MGNGYLLTAVGMNAKQLGEAARRAGLQAHVPTCPEWTVSDLVGHIGLVHRWVLGILITKPTERPERPPGPAEGEDLFAWFDEGAAQLVETLAGYDLTQPLWNWAASSPEPARFWLRRMAHETVIHRVDAESAAGVDSRVEPAELAADGLDELFELIAVRHRGDERMQALEGGFHFHTTDVPGEWVLEFASGRLEVRREHAKSPVAVRGPASALELFAYNRGPADDLEVLGDAALVDEWRNRVRF